MKTVQLILLWAVLILCQSPTVQGQYIPSENYTLENGLAHSNVLRLFQDSGGYLWLGTQYGISRFDGESFLNYTTSDGLAGNTVMSMNELPDGALLVGSHRGGMSVIRQGKVYPYRVENDIPSGILYTIADRRGRMWIINKGGIGGGSWECGYIDSNRYHPFLLHTFLGEQKPVEVYRVMALADSSVVLATERGAFIVSAAGQVALLSSGITEPVYVTVQDTQGALWFGAKDKLYIVRNDGGTLETIPLADNGIINVMLATRDGSVWVYSRQKGLVCLKDGRLVNYTSAFSLATTIVNELLEDREGSLWIGTYSRGVYRINDFRMRHYTVEAGLPSNYVSAVAEDEAGRIWIGYMGGVGIIENGRFRPLSTPLLHNDDIVNALLVVNGECWALTPWKVIGITAQGRSRNLWPLGGASLYRTPTDIYVGNYKGHYSTQPVWKRVGDPVLMHRRINSMLYDRNNGFWVATDTGIYCRRGDVVYHYGAPDGFAAKEAYSLCLDSSGAVWCAADNGLYTYNGTAWRAFTTADGLSHNRCSSVLCDRSGAIWIGTLRGVNKFDGRSFTWYNAYKGLAGDEVNTLFLDSRNYLWIGAVNGLTQFDIGRKHNTVLQPPVHITEVRAGNRLLVSGVPTELNAYEHTLYFQFRAIQLSNYREVRYRYKLLGSDSTWYTTQETAVRYSSLSPGNYTFVVQAALSEDGWASAQSARFSFTINIPFWQTWWFIGSCCVVFALLVFLGVFIRERWFKRRQAEKLSVYSRMLNLRQQALTALVNPHFVFNSLNSIQFFINRSNKELANEYLANFADLIRRTMEDSQCVVVPLCDELSRLELYLELEALRFSNRFRYSVFVDPELDTEEIMIPVMLIQPYVENSIWHGIMPKDGRGEVRIVVKGTPESRLNIVIEDDGVGIEAGKKKKHSLHQHTSRGMQIMQERLELIGKMANDTIVVSVREITDEHGHACGTRVELELPLGLEHIATGVSTVPE